MNMAFVDLTDAPGTAAGSPVTLIGRDGEATMGADELAAACGTIAYEIVARLPAAMPRRYVNAESAVATTRLRPSSLAR
jgi:alanine racemase